MRIPFEIGRPQIFAGLMLLWLLAMSLLSLVVSDAPIPEAPANPALLGPLPAFLNFAVLRFAPTDSSDLLLRILSAMPFIGASLLLGGAIWWVSRRLYGNAGGYVALASYVLCPFSFLPQWISGANMMSALGGYAFIFTAMGVAHTIYAPPRKWRARIVLLAVTFAFTLASSVHLAALSLCVAIAFMLYLAPGRRRIATGILALAVGAATAAVAVVIANSPIPLPEFVPGLHQLFPLDYGQVPLMRAAAAATTLPLAFLSLLPYLAWRRARWFGNTSALIPAALFLLVPAVSFYAGPVWAMPFLATFAGGVAADVFESPRWGRWASIVVATLLAVAGLVESVAVLLLSV